MSYPESLWQSSEQYGGTGGCAYKALAKAGARVKALGFYKHSKKGWEGIPGMVIKYTNGEKVSIGSTNDEYAEFSFQELEKITEMSLFITGNKSDPCLGRVVFRTNKDRTYDWGYGTRNEHRIDVGSGYLIGFVGRSGLIIDAAGPIFFKVAKKAYIDHVEYPNLNPSDTSFLELRTLKTMKGEWGGNPYKFTFEGTKSVAVATTWNQKLTLEMGLELTYKTGVPMIMGTEAKLTMKIGGQFDRGGSTTTTETLKWSSTHEINKPEDAVECIATYYEGSMDVEWKGRFNFVSEDGQVHFWPTSGTLEQVLCTQVVVTTKSLSENRSLDDGADGEVRALEDHDDENEELEYQDQQEDTADYAEANEDTEVLDNDNTEDFSTQAEENYDEEAVPQATEQEAEEGEEAADEPLDEPVDEQADDYSQEAVEEQIEESTEEQANEYAEEETRETAEEPVEDQLEENAGEDTQEQIEKYADGQANELVYEENPETVEEQVGEQSQEYADEFPEEPVEKYDENAQQYSEEPAENLNVEYAVDSPEQDTAEPTDEAEDQYNDAKVAEAPERQYYSSEEQEFTQIETEDETHNYTGYRKDSYGASWESSAVY